MVAARRAWRSLIAIDRVTTGQRAKRSGTAKRSAVLKRFDDRPLAIAGAAIALAMTLGLGLDYAGLDAVKMLFWAAVVNGALAPPLLILVVLLTSREDVMGEHRNGLLLRWLGLTCAGVMLLATIIMFVTAFAA